MNLEVRLMERTYSVLVFGNEENDIMLVLKFTDQKFQNHRHLPAFPPMTDADGADGWEP